MQAPADAMRRSKKLTDADYATAVASAPGIAIATACSASQGFLQRRGVQQVTIRQCH
jgi:hypothetical protein